MEPVAMPLVDTKSCNARHVMGFDRFCRNDKIGRVLYVVCRGYGLLWYNALRQHRH